MLALLPGAVLVSGVLMTTLQSGGALPGSAMRLSLIAAAVAPVVAAVVLALVAPGFDALLVSVSAMLAGIGMANLFALAMGPTGSDDFYGAIVTRHGFFVAGGFLAMIAGTLLASRLDALAKYPYTLLMLAVGGLAATALLGETVNGARLWLTLGPLRFQPSEIARLLLVLFIAVYLHEHRHLVAGPWRVGRFELPPVPYLLPLAGAVLVAAGVLVFQNDLGMAALVVLGTIACVAALMPSRAMVLLAMLLTVAGAVAAYEAAPRIRDRVLGWLGPWRDPGGRGFQFVQGDFGLAAGGLAGSRPSAARRVPEVHTDFAIVAIGQSFGLLVASAVLALTAILICRCALAALRSRDQLGALVAMCFTVLLGIQTVLIVGGTLRVLPLTGVTLPLVSYGGTSMIVTFFVLGVILGVGAPSGRNRTNSSETPASRAARFLA